MKKCIKLIVFSFIGKLSTISPMKENTIYYLNYNTASEAIKITHLRTWDSWDGGGKALGGLALIATGCLIFKKLIRDIEKNQINQYPRAFYQLLDQNRKIIYEGANWIITFLPTTTYFPIQQYLKTKEKNKQSGNLIQTLFNANRKITAKNTTLQNDNNEKNNDAKCLTFHKGVPLYRYFPQLLYDFIMNSNKKIQDYFDNNFSIITQTENKENHTNYKIIGEMFQSLIKEFEKKEEKKEEEKEEENLQEYKKIIIQVKKILQNEWLIFNIIKEKYLQIIISIVLFGVFLKIKKYIENNGINKKAHIIHYLKTLSQKNFCPNLANYIAELIIYKVNEIYCTSYALLYFIPLFTSSLITFNYYNNKLTKLGLLNQTIILYQTTPKNYLKEGDDYYKKFKDVKKTYLNILKNNSSRTVQNKLENLIRALTLQKCKE